METLITLIRHGETDWNVERRWQGFENTSLNENGRQQARDTAQYLYAAGFTRIISSDLARALETAIIIGEILNLSVATDERLREINVGKWQGLTHDEISVQYPEEYALAAIEPYIEMRFPGGESRAELRQRAGAALNDFVQHYPGEHILVSTHGGTIRTILHNLMQPLPDERFHNCCLTRLRYTGTTWQAIGINLEAKNICW